MSQVKRTCSGESLTIDFWHRKIETLEWAWEIWDRRLILERRCIIINISIHTFISIRHRCSHLRLRQHSFLLQLSVLIALLNFYSMFFEKFMKLRDLYGTLYWELFGIVEYKFYKEISI